MATDGDKLTPKRQRFADGYLSHGNATQAYIDAGYDVEPDIAKAAASRLLTSVNVAAYIANVQREASELAILNQTWVLLRLKENVERSMKAVPVLDRKGVPTGEYQYEGAVANRSLELIGKHLGMFKEPPGDDNARKTFDMLVELFSKRNESGDGPVIDVEPTGKSQMLIEGRRD